MPISSVPRSRIVAITSLFFLSGCLTVVVQPPASPEDVVTGGVPEEQEPLRLVDEFYVDSRTPGPTRGRVVLERGRVYEVVIDGTYSVWAASYWRGACAGASEPSPRYPRGGGGPVAIDPSYVFAVARGSHHCGLDVPIRRSNWYYRLRTWGDWQAGATEAPYNPAHEYRREVVGEGEPFQAFIYDSPGDYGDNYGAFRLKIYEIGPSAARNEPGPRASLTEGH